jgi:hypothetical protein
MLQTPEFIQCFKMCTQVMGPIVIIVPFFMLLLFKMLMLQTLVFYPATCISAGEDVMQISVIPILPSVVFLRWSETACRVPVQTLSVVMIMTPCLIITVERRVHHGCCVEHRL